MDESRSLVAKQLIEAVPEIDKAVNNLKVIVVGAGDDYDNVKTMADSVNQSWVVMSLYLQVQEQI